MAVQSALASSPEVGRPLTFQDVQTPSPRSSPSLFLSLSPLSSLPKLLKPKIPWIPCEDDGDHDCSTPSWKVLNHMEGPTEGIDPVSIRTTASMRVESHADTHETSDPSTVTCRFSHMRSAFQEDSRNSDEKMSFSVFRHTALPRPPFLGPDFLTPIFLHNPASRLVHFD